MTKALRIADTRPQMSKDCKIKHKVKKDPPHWALADMAVSLLLNCLLVSMYHNLNFRLSVSTFPDFWSLCFLLDSDSRFRKWEWQFWLFSCFWSQLTGEFLFFWRRYFSSSALQSSSTRISITHTHTQTLMLWKIWKTSGSGLQHANRS